MKNQKSAVAKRIRRKSGYAMDAHRRSADRARPATQRSHKYELV